MTSATTTESFRPSLKWSGKKANFQSLADGMGGHRNSLGILRLVLASLVIVSHAFPLGGWGEDPMSDWTKRQESIGGLAVVGFFAISGYLIAKSGVGTDVVQFLWRRVLRIFPAFWLVLLVGAGIVGPIVWLAGGGSFSDYLRGSGAGGPLGYVINNADLTMRQWGIHEIFLSTPWGERAGTSVFNGSLWTLVYEWSCYLIIAALVLFGILRHAKFLVLMLTAFYYGVAVSNVVAPGLAASIIPPFGDSFRVNLTLIFLIGSCLGLYSRKIPLSDILGIASAIVALLTLAFGGWVLLGYPAFAYFLFWAAARLPRGVQWIGAKNDYSYGVYVYGFLIQQLTASWGWNQWGYVPWVIATGILTGGCAWVSWHLVEKRAMSLKDLGPGQGIQFWFDRVVGLFRRSPRGAAKAASE